LKIKIFFDNVSEEDCYERVEQLIALEKSPRTLQTTIVFFLKSNEQFILGIAQFGHVKFRSNITSIIRWFSMSQL